MNLLWDEGVPVPFTINVTLNLTSDLVFKLLYPEHIPYII